MDFNKFTQKSMEAVQNANNEAIKYGNPQVEELHLHYALVNDKEGLIPKVIKLMGIDVASYLEELKLRVEGLPKQSGGSTYASKDFNNALNEAQ